MRFRSIILFLLLTGSLLGDESSSSPSPESTSRLSNRDAVILGLVEGVTEFLPISSTGHLIITNHLLGLDSDAPILDAVGNPIWLQPPSIEHPAGVAITLKTAADTYIVVIQVGAIVVIVLIFWPSLRIIINGLTGRDANGLKLLRNIALAFFPVVIVGLSLNDYIDEHLFSIKTVIGALLVGAGLMYGAEYWRRRVHKPGDPEKSPSELSPLQSLQIGVVQCLALWPGMSRSMVTMVGGYFCGLAPAKAAEFSFLVGLPVLGGAAVYKAWQTGPVILTVFGWTEMILGALVAAVSAGVAVRFLVSYLQRFGLGAFAIYRVVLAVVLALTMLK